jgi:hypothetical protein
VILDYMDIYSTIRGRFQSGGSMLLWRVWGARITDGREFRFPRGLFVPGKFATPYSYRFLKEITFNTNAYFKMPAFNRTMVPAYANYRFIFRLPSGAGS